jgi:hypothetical protein
MMVNLIVIFSVLGIDLYLIVIFKEEIWEALDKIKIIMLDLKSLTYY